MTTQAGAGTIACAKCGAGNAPGARFCGACGAPSGTQQSTPPPQPPPVFGQSGFGGAASSRFGMGAMGGAYDIQTVAPMDAGEAFEHIGQTIAAMGGRAFPQGGSSAMQIEIPYKDLMYTGGFTVRYRGQLTLAAQGPGQTLVQAKLSPDWSSCGMPALCLFGCAFFAGMSAPLFFMMWLIGGAAMGAISAWTMTGVVQRKAADRLVAAMSGQAPAQAPRPNTRPKFEMPKMGAGFGGFTGQQQPPHQPPQAANDTPIEQLERLGRLRDSGVLTAEEFEAKKADILKRL